MHMADSIDTLGTSPSRSGRPSEVVSTRGMSPTSRYSPSNGEEYLPNDTATSWTTDDELSPRDAQINQVAPNNVIYTPGIETPSIMNTPSPKPEPEDESTRQIIAEFILQHTTPGPTSRMQMNMDPSPPPPPSASPRASHSASPQASGTRLTLPERNRILNSDTRTDLVKSDEVKCGKCKEWIKVSQTSISDWEKHANTCFNFNCLTSLQIAKRIELAGDIRVTSFGPRHVECAFCGSVVALKGAEDYTLKSWKLHIAHCRGWDKERNHSTSQPTNQNQSNTSPNQRSTTRAERLQRARKRQSLFLSRGSIRWPLPTRPGLRSSATGPRLRNTTINQRSTNPSRPFSRRYQRTAGTGKHKRPRVGGREQPTEATTQPSLGFTSTSSNREGDQSAPRVTTVRPIDTRPSANTRARAVVYTRPENLKQQIIGRERASS